MLFFTNPLSHQNHAKVIGEILQYKLNDYPYIVR